MINEEAIKEMVSEMAGERAFSLVKAIMGRKDVNEFKLSDSLDLNINQARNILYKLYSYNLVSFKRRKDRRRGWYIYYWTFNPKRAEEIINKLRSKKRERLNATLDNKGGVVYFVCLADGNKLAYEEAMNNDFKCPHCGGLMSQESQRYSISEIKEKIKLLEEPIKLDLTEEGPSDLEEELEKKKEEKPEEKKKPRKKTKKKVKTPKKGIVKKKKNKKRPKKKIQKKRVKKIKKKKLKKKNKKTRKKKKR